jgi:NAD(P)H dehydrogenase (quinone)
MKKVLVAYYSKSGNTEKMAGMIANVLKAKGVEADLKKVEDINVDSLPSYDGYIVGSPNYFGGMAWPVKKFFDDSVKYFKKLEGKLGAAFTTTGMIGGGGETVVLDILKAFLIHGCVVQGLCSAGHYGPVSIGAPDERITREVDVLVSKFVPMLNKL